jgi:hypothetical protein
MPNPQRGCKSSFTKVSFDDFARNDGASNLLPKSVFIRVHPWFKTPSQNSRSPSRHSRKTSSLHRLKIRLQCPRGIPPICIGGCHGPASEMAKNEKSSPKMATLASKVLRTSKSKPARRLAASVLTQAADKKKKK